MFRFYKNISIFTFILCLVSANNFGLSYSVVESIDFPALDANITKRVDDLINSGKYNLTYFTDFEHGPDNTWARSQKAMVTSSDVRCSRVGAYYLEHGGNAIDAAVAASICLNVIEIASSGFTGGGTSLSFVNGMPRIIDFRPYHSDSSVKDESTEDTRYARAFKIPGMAMGLYELWKQGGKIEWKTLFDIPILIAYKGWDIKPSFNRMLIANEIPLKENAFLKELLFNGDTLKKTKDRIVNIPLTRTLQLLSMDYKNMYLGAIPSIMMNQIGKKNYDSLLTEISQYKTNTEKPLSIDLNEDRKMLTNYETSGGPLLTYILNAMKGYKKAHPEVFHEDGTVDDVYYVVLYDILMNGRKLLPLLRTDEKVKVIDEAFTNFTNDGTVVIPIVKKLIDKKEDTPDDECNEDEEEDVSGSVSLSAYDDCGNGISMQIHINHLFGAKSSFPSLGLVENTYTAVKTDQNGKIIRGEFAIFNTYSTPVIVIGKSDNQIYQMFSGTGGRKVPSAVAQVIINYNFRNLNPGVSVTNFRMFTPYEDNRIYQEQESPIPTSIVNFVASKRGVTLRVIPYHYSTSVSEIIINRDEFGYPTTIVGVGDHRRNGGVGAV